MRRPIVINFVRIYFLVAILVVVFYIQDKQISIEHHVSSSLGWLPTEPVVSSSTLKSTRSSSSSLAMQFIHGNNKIPSNTTVTDEISTRALQSLDAKHEWMSHVRFMVIGAQKSGTTSLYWNIVLHSRIKSNCKECICFASWKYQPKDPYCERRLHFKDNNEEDKGDGRGSTHPNYAVGDFSPGYLFQEDIVMERISKVYPWVKIIAILREPTSRAYSEYQMRFRNKKIQTSFREAVLADIQSLYSVGMLPHFQFNESTATYHLTVEDWFNVPIDLKIFDRWFGTQQMSHAWISYWNIKGINQRMFVSQGLYAVGLWRWMSVFPRSRFLVLHADDQKQTDTLKQMIQRVFEFLDLPFEDTTVLTSPSQTEEEEEKAEVTVETTATTTRIEYAGNYTEPMPNDVRLLLEKVYRPFNAMLEVLLLDIDERWRDPFPY